MSVGARNWIAASAALTVVFVTGCGDDKQKAKDTFVRKADAVCKRVLAENPRPKPARTQARAIRATSAANKRASGEERRLKSLKAPKEQQRDFAAYKIDTHQLQQLAVAGQAAAIDGRQALYGQALKDAKVKGKHREAVAKRIGFRVCGKPPPGAAA